VRDQVNENFHETSQKLFNECTMIFRKEVANLVVEGSGWGEQAVVH